jgi:15-cis-phytoene synthase
MIMLRPLVLAYASSAVRADLSALFDLDAALGRIVASTTEAMIGQMRLTWWHERLAALGKEKAPAEPILSALRDLVIRGAISGDALAAMVEGWEALLDPMPLDPAALQIFAQKRGDGLFTLAAEICQKPVSIGLGAGWALVDFAMHCSDDRTATKAVHLAHDYFSNNKISGPKPLRILAHVARAKAKQPPELIRQPISRLMILRAVLN